MYYELAPMEGVTGYVFRNAYHASFQDFDKYITPFLSPTSDCVINPKELKEISPEHNQGMNVTPQIITSRSELFVTCAKALEQYGYREVNLNLGCPSQTVVSKKKGAGVLRDFEHVKELLDGIALHCPIPFSVKTRVGFLEAEEFSELLSIYEQIPMSELIIHPRTRAEFYSGTIHEECVQEALKRLKTPIIYNGDIVNVQGCNRRMEQFSEAKGVMLGRGLAANPCLLEEIKRQERMPEEEFRKRLQDFLDLLLEGHTAILKDEATALFRLKELWGYLSQTFEGIDKPVKVIKKTTKVLEYKMAVKEIIRNGKRK